ncbi:Hydrogenase maturation factor HybF [subsurface metagenome]
MHELSIATQMIEVISEHLSEYPDSRVDSVLMAVGEYSGVDPESLRMVFPLAAEGTLVEGSELIIKTVPSSIKCSDCGAGAEEIGILQCPQCGSINLELATGNELEIISFDIIQKE